MSDNGIETSRITLPPESPARIRMRCEAHNAGEAQYFTGRPCVRGHVVNRITKTGVCVGCSRDRQKESYADPIRREQRLDWGKKWRELNPEKQKAASKAWNEKQKTKSKPKITSKQCAKCSLVKLADDFYKKTSSVSGLTSYCKSCFVDIKREWATRPKYQEGQLRKYEKKQKWRAENPKLNWATDCLRGSKFRAKNRGMEHDLTVEWLVANLKERCPVLDIPFSFARKKHWYDSPTVDRVDNTKGYTQANCWIISGRANRLKGEASLEEMIIGFGNIVRELQRRQT